MGINTMIRSRWRRGLGGRKLIKVGKLPWIGGVGGGGQIPVGWRSRIVAAIGDIVALSSSMAVHEAPLAPVMLVGTSGRAVELPLVGAAASETSASKTCASKSGTSRPSSSSTAVVVSDCWYRPEC